MQSSKEGAYAAFVSRRLKGVGKLRTNESFGQYLRRVIDATADKTSEFASRIGIDSDLVERLFISDAYILAIPSRQIAKLLSACEASLNEVIERVDAAMSWNSIDVLNPQVAATPPAKEIVLRQFAQTTAKELKLLGRADLL